jgi:hypothetical protein
MTHNLAELHAAVATVEAEIADLATRAATGRLGATSVDELRASWATLLLLLALPPPPITRLCPRCRQTVMRAATRCGYCWLGLEPPVAEA